jgi:hypothetical protein
MGVTLAALLAVIVLGGPFGEATVEGAPAGDHLRVELEIAVAGSPAAVVAHAVDPGQTQETISLGDRGGGLWGGVADLEVMNFVLVFEVIYADGESALSGPTTLLELGMDPALLGMEEVVGVEGDDGSQPLSAETRRWGWGAVALVAVALALLAVWAMGDRVGSKDEMAPQGVQEPEHQVVPDATPDGVSEETQRSADD